MIPIQRILEKSNKYKDHEKFPDGIEKHDDAEGSLLVYIDDPTVERGSSNLKK
jgi:hypothetical protein